METALKTLVDIQMGYQAKTRIMERVRGTHRLIQSKDFDSSHRLRSGNLTTFFPEGYPCRRFFLHSSHEKRKPAPAISGVVAESIESASLLPVTGKWGRDVFYFQEHTFPPASPDPATSCSEKSGKDRNARQARAIPSGQAGVRAGASYPSNLYEGGEQ